MNKIEYSNWTFTDADIVSGSVAMENAMMFDSLNPDELTVEVISHSTGTGKVLVQPESGQDLEWYTTVNGRGYVVSDGDIRNYRYGRAVWYYYNGVLQGVYYLRSVERLSVDHFRINAISLAGMWASVQHMGGLYGKDSFNNQDTVGTVLNEIIKGGYDHIGGQWEFSQITFEGITYTVEGDFIHVDGLSTGNSGVFVADPVLRASLNNGYYISIENGDGNIGVRVYCHAAGFSQTTETYSGAYLGIPSGINNGIIFTEVNLFVNKGASVTNRPVRIRLTKGVPTETTYTIDPDVAATKVFGWLPIASVRDNVQQVLFAAGASMMKDANGNPHFCFLQNLSPKSIPNDRIFIGGNVSYKEPSSSVQVTEHSYYQTSLDLREVLFDNTDGASGAATNLIVPFDKPYYDLEWAATSSSTASPVGGGSNFYVANGTGILTGKPYTHTMRAFTVPTGANTLQPKESKVEKATLVSPVNAPNVAARVADYLGTAEEVACGIVMSDDAIKCGTLVSFNDPYGDAATGIVSKMNITMSGKSKADCTIVKGYTPSHFGNTFTNCVLITESGSWTIPAGKELIRIVLGQGGQAGQNGYNGTNSTKSVSSQDYSAQAGAGGAGGSAGSGGKVYFVDIQSPSGVIDFSIGDGGTPRTTQGGVGYFGDHTTATYNGTTYTSNSGSIPVGGYRDIINGRTYSVSGIDGVDGANGGDVGSSSTSWGETVGGNVTYNGQTWKGGSVGNPLYGSSETRWAMGGAGGGAAYGTNGGNGGDGFLNSIEGVGTFYKGGTGGSGANAKQLPYTPQFGSGGAGGCGGGGGGCGGRDIDDRHQTTTGGAGFGDVGIGGAFSKGTVGGRGYALVYY